MTIQRHTKYLAPLRAVTKRPFGVVVLALLLASLAQTASAQVIAIIANVEDAVTHLPITGATFNFPIYSSQAGEYVLSVDLSQIQNPYSFDIVCFAQGFQTQSVPWTSPPAPSSVTCNMPPSSSGGSGGGGSGSCPNAYGNGNCDDYGWYEQFELLDTVIPKAQPNSGLSAYTIADGQHIYYVGSDQHVHQLFWMNPQGTEYSNLFYQDLSKYNGYKELAATNSPVSAFADANGQHIYFVDTSQDVHEFSYSTNGAWSDTDINATTGAKALAGTGMSSYSIADGRHIYYIASNQHVHQLYYSSTQKIWFNQDLTGYNGTKELAATDSPVCAFADADGQHIYFIDTYRDIHEFLYSTNGTWSDTTINAGGPTAALSTGLAAYSIADGKHVYYIGGDHDIQHVLQLYYSSSQKAWSIQDLTGFNGNQELAAGNSSLSAMADAYGQHIFFVATYNGAREYLYDTTGTWHDLTIGDVPTPGGAISAFAIAGGQGLVLVNEKLNVIEETN